MSWKKGIKYYVLSIMGVLLLGIIHTTNYIIPIVHAQDTIPLPSYVPATSPIYTDLLVHNMFHTFSCLAIGSSFINQPCLTYQAGIPVLSNVNLSGGALGAETSIISLLYTNPPVRTANYLANLGENLGIVKVASAQQIAGSGAQVLDPIINLWQVSRNISYLAIIIIFVVIGLMVMFRSRINPQTVITAQAALPGLIIGLVLITFSYFLAGLISDTAFVGTNIVGYYFGAARGGASQNLLKDLDKTYSNYEEKPNGRKPNLISIFSKFATVANKEKITSVLDSFWDDINVDAQRLLVLLASFTSAQLTGQATEFFKAVPKVGEGIIASVQLITAATTALDPKAVVGFLFGLVITAILLYTMFKLLLRLVNAYLTIIFLTLTAPFQFLAASLPGRQGIATGWILNMLANVLAFPAVLAIFYFVAFLLGPSNGPYGPFLVSNSEPKSFISQASAQTGSSINIVSNNSFPLFGGMGLDFIRLLLAFGALIATPAIPDIINRTIGRVGQAGQLIGQEISGGIGQGRGYGQQFQQGIGTASQRGATARGLFDTPGYGISGEGTARRVGEQYGPGFGANFGWLRRVGIRKGPPKNA